MASMSMPAGRSFSKLVSIFMTPQNPDWEESWWLISKMKRPATAPMVPKYITSARPLRSSCIRAVGDSEPISRLRRASPLMETSFRSSTAPYRSAEPLTMISKLAALL